MQPGGKKLHLASGNILPGLWLTPCRILPVLDEQETEQHATEMREIGDTRRTTAQTEIKLE